MKVEIGFLKKFKLRERYYAHFSQLSERSKPKFDTPWLNAKTGKNVLQLINAVAKIDGQNRL